MECSQNKCPSRTLFWERHVKHLFQQHLAPKALPCIKDWQNCFDFVPWYPLRITAKEFNNRWAFWKANLDEWTFHLWNICRAQIPLDNTPSRYTLKKFLAVLYIFIRWTIFWRMFIRCTTMSSFFCKFHGAVPVYSVKFQPMLGGFCNFKYAANLLPSSVLFQKFKEHLKIFFQIINIF
jgi:hypothetical protein